MAKYTGSVCKHCRREGEKLFLKGQRCYTPKCAIERREYPPGDHGRQAQWRRRRVSEYWRQLREKQKTRRVYNVRERQFRRYYAKALQTRGMTGQNLLQMLERRLDNVIYRLNFAESRAQGRLLVTHDLEQGLSLSDRIIIFVRGRIAFDQRTASISAEQFRRAYFEHVAAGQGAER